MMNHKTIFFTMKNGEAVEVERNEDDGSLWMSIASLSLLYEKDRSTLLRKIRKEITLTAPQSGSVCAKFAHTGDDGKTYQVDHFKVDFILETSLKSKADDLEDFRKWVLQNERPQISKIIRYHQDNVDLQVRLSAKEKTVWLTQAQMAELFDSSVPNIVTHLRNIYDSGELDEGATCKKYLIVQQESGRTVHRSVSHYNLDAILAVGYRVNSQRGIEFRIWATGVLSRYLQNGFALDHGYLLDHTELLLRMSSDINEIRHHDDVQDARIDSLMEQLEGETYERIFLAGKLYEPRVAIASLLAKAKHHIAIVDSFFDLLALSLCENVDKSVAIDVYTDRLSRIKEAEVDAFNHEHAQVAIHRIKDIHDRFLIIDEKEYYLLGASLNGAGKQSFAIVEMKSEQVRSTLLALLNDPS